MSFTHPDAVPSAPNPAMATQDVSMFTNTDPETRDDSRDPWKFEVSTGCESTEWDVGTSGTGLVFPFFPHRWSIG